MNFKNIPKEKLIKLIIGLGACLLLALIYLGGIIYYSSHFLPQTYINEVDVSGKTKEQANELLKDISPYIDVLQIGKNNETVTDRFDLREMEDDIAYDASAILKDQDKTAWFAPKEKQLICNKITGSYTKARIKSFIQDFYFLNKEEQIQPQNAALAIENDKVVLKDAIDGNLIEEKTVISKIDEAIKAYFNGNGSETLDLADAYIKPTLLQDDPSFEGKTETYQKALDKKITINITEDKKEELMNTSLSSLLKFEENELIPDQDKLTQYIYDLYTEHKNDASTYIDRAALQNSLYKALPSLKDENVEVVWIPSQHEGRIDVDIPEQKLDYYENDTLILSSPIVSGNGEITDETPHGEFYIRKMSTDSYLMGRDYLEHVDFWIGFDPSGRVYGLHDASWRDKFGEDIYLTDPSRGCVNMPTDKITILFDYANVGTEIIVHD